MMIKQAALSNAVTASFNPDARQLRTSKSFYDHVRSDFLRQSAVYLRESLSKGKTVSDVYNSNLVLLQEQGGPLQCY